ncbi:sugar phosphate isomerase/epimerase family protein [Paenibacillus puerhi]|uniref:sugar phosphate isomerase/epimerase family protein n=1 Tax=Paenibacillus puerhi TaxID=2692622 RepID=UPI00135CA38D|nr:sugar phosphate isomerase/epimerase [Paenibacillus puerhi]
MSWWGMNGLQGRLQEEGPDSAWSDEAKVRLIAEAGFDGINGFIPEPGLAPRWRKLLAEYGLSFSVNAYPASAADMADYLKQALAYGKDSIQHINAQVMTPFLTGDGAVRLLRDIRELSVTAGIPIYVETHRGTITQDLLRTAAYIEELVDLRLTIDFSHYVVAGEMRNPSSEAVALLHKLLRHTAAIHGRISNGEQVQVDIGPDGIHEMVPRFLDWWRIGMSHWRQTAGEHEAFPFVCELGPPPYAITADEYAGRTVEIADRWQQSLWLAQAARTIWRESVSAEKD